METIHHLLRSRLLREYRIPPPPPLFIARLISRRFRQLVSVFELLRIYTHAFSKGVNHGWSKKKKNCKVIRDGRLKATVRHFPFLFPP